MIAREKRAASAAEQGMPGSLSSWLGGVELSEDENRQCFRLTMKHILETELTPDQRQNFQYQWDPHGTTGPSRMARSLHDVIVRNHLGHKSTAQHIYQHGLPRLFAASGRRDATHRVKSGRWCSATAAEHRVGSLDLASGRCSSAIAAEHRDLDQMACFC